MRETLLAVVLGHPPSKKRLAVAAVKRFVQSLSPARRRKLRVSWVLPAPDVSLSDVHLPKGLKQEVVPREEVRDADLWLALDPDVIPELDGCAGVVVTMGSRHGRSAKGIISLPMSEGEDAVQMLAESLAWVYDDPGLKEMIRKRKVEKAHSRKDDAPTPV